MAEDFRLSDFLPYQLAVLSERVSRRLSVDYGRRLGLSLAEWRVLVHLGHGGDVSVREICTRVNMDKPRVSRAVARLETAGLVRKVPGEADKRLVVISLTPAGQTALRDITPEAQEVEARLKAAILPEDYACFIAVMEQMHQVLDADPDAQPRALV